jgi:hypothetical protein
MAILALNASSAFWLDILTEYTEWYVINTNVINTNVINTNVINTNVLQQF